jgi:type-F conjugative transfer system pilin assembly protein TrbC
MAQKKLLLVLKITLLFAFVDVGFCANHIGQLSDLRQRNIDSLKKLLSGDNTYNVSENSEESTLYLFISSAMPRSLLRNYYNEASNYNATLVLNGLPKSSFRELADLVREISSSGKNVPVIIDDESYKRFNIAHVPSFVLFKSEDCLGEEICNIKFDKISGNIGIRKSLEIFSEAGDLANFAKRYLR